MGETTPWSEHRRSLESVAGSIGTEEWLSSAIFEALSRLDGAEDGELDVAAQRDALLRLLVVDGKCTVCDGDAPIETGMRGHARRCAVRLALAERRKGA